MTRQITAYSVRVDYLAKRGQGRNHGLHLLTRQMPR